MYEFTMFFYDPGYKILHATIKSETEFDAMVSVHKDAAQFCVERCYVKYKICAGHIEHFSEQAEV